MERVYSVIPYAPHLLDRFVHSFLKTDGVFVLRLMANHAGDMIVVHVVAALWQEFRERNWREFEDFEEIKDQQLRRPIKATILRFEERRERNRESFRDQPHRVVTISNPVATIMSESINSEKGYL